MSNIEYNFDEIGTDKKKEVDVRVNYKIARCCGNCKYFWYNSNKPRRGFCKLPDPHLKGIAKRIGQKYDEVYIRQNWFRTHITNACDHHRFRSKWFSIGRVSEWVGKVFNFDGSLLEED